MMRDERAKVNHGTRSEKKRKIKKANRVKYNWPVHCSLIIEHAI